MACPTCGTEFCWICSKECAYCDEYDDVTKNICPKCVKLCPLCESGECCPDDMEECEGCGENFCRDCLPDHEKESADDERAAYEEELGIVYGDPDSGPDDLEE